MTKATAAFYAYDEKLSRDVLYRPGDKVPDHVARNVGTHVIDKKPAGSSNDGETVTLTKDELDQLVAERVSAAVGADAITEEDVVKARAEERAAVIAEYDEPLAFNPDDYNVDEVLAELAKHDAGSVTYARILQAERSGQARKTILGD